MKRFRKLLSLLLTLIIVVGVVSAAPLTAYADDAPFSKNGICGAENEEDVEWYAFNDNSMVFFGSGAIKNYTDNTGSNPAPRGMERIFPSSRVRCSSTRSPWNTASPRSATIAFM